MHNSIYNLKSMKLLFRTLLLLSMSFLSLWASAQVLSIGGINTSKLNIGTGNNFLLVGGINDNSPGDQAIAFTATSSNPAVLSILGVDYTTGNSIAVIRVREFGTVGNVNITLTGTDADGTASRVYNNVSVGLNFPQGVNFGVYDIVFWQNVVPVSEAPVGTNIISAIENRPTPADPTINGVNFNSLDLTVGCATCDANNDGIIDCCGGAVKGSFYTLGFTGVIVPSVTGIYFFTIDYQDGGAFWLSNNESIPNSSSGAKAVIGKFTGDNDARANGSTVSDTAWLIANKPYGFRAANWVVFSERFQARWSYRGTDGSIFTQVNASSLGFILTTSSAFNASTQGKSLAITSQGTSLDNIRGAGTLIGGNSVFTSFDNIVPSAPSNLTLIRKSTESFDIKWNRPSDYTTNIVNGYKLYLNGQLIRTFNNVKDTTFRIFNLLPGTTYSIAVTAFDLSTNESNASNILTESTVSPDASAPTPPTSVVVDQLGDISARISWSGAADAESGIYGYKVFVNGEEYNKDTLQSTSIILKTYAPSSTLNVEVESYNGAKLKSTTKSNVLVVNLNSFDPSVQSPGVKKARMNITTNFIGKHAGFGINGDWNTIGYYNQSSVDLHKELKTRLIRWGALTANPYRFADKIGISAKNYGSPNATSIPAQNAQTTGISYAKFVKMANDLNAYASICIGSDSTPVSDWRAFPERTARRLIIYLTATLTTPGLTDVEREIVQERIAEGYPNSLLNNSKGILIEFGNEPWGGTSFGAGVDHNADLFTNYTRYGAWCRRLARGFKDAPGYDSTKIKLFYSIRKNSPDETFGTTQNLFSATDIDVVDGISSSGYLGGNFVERPNQEFGASELEYYRSGWKTLKKNIDGIKETQDLDFAKTKKIRPFYYYESNMTLANYNQRVGQGILMMDYFLTSAKLGVMLPTLFSLSGGEWGIVSAQGDRNPLFVMSSVLDSVAFGNILSTSVQSTETVLDQSGSVISSFEPVSQHCYYENGKYKIVLISRDFENPYNVQINLPDGMNFASTANMYMVTSTGVGTRQSTLVTSSVSISDGSIVVVPPYSIVILEFTGDPINNIPLPLGYTKYRKPTSFSVTDNLDGSDVVSTPFTIELSPEVLPMNAANSSVKWSVIASTDNAIGDIVQLTSADGKYYIDANTCFGEGNSIVLTLSGTLYDDPNLGSYSKVVTVTSSFDINFEPCLPPTVPPTSFSLTSKPSDNSVVTLPSVITITPTIEPQNVSVADKEIEWTITGNNTTTVLSGIKIMPADVNYVISLSGCVIPSDIDSLMITVSGVLKNHPSLGTKSLTYKIDNTVKTCVLSTSNFEKSVDFDIYPNPSNGDVTFKSDGAGELRVVNSQGIIVYVDRIHDNGTTKLLSLPSGVYHVSFNNSKSIVSKKLVVTR